jgi:hypothetical protein
VPDALDGQGNCNAVRVNAANELMTWFAGNPTGTGDADVLLLGDYNSYAMEDPITLIKNAGYTNLIASFVSGDPYSYVFDGQWGYLDHALGSASIVGQVKKVSEYHIDADEPSVLDYNTDFKTANLQNTLYAPDQFRISDHDPVIVDLFVNGPPTVGTPTVSAEPSVEGATVVASATFTDRYADTPYTCTVSYGDGSGVLPGSVSGSTCTGPAHAYTTFGTYTVTVSVTDTTGATGSASGTHVVIFAFAGFSAPVGNPPTLNTPKAGAAAPVKFGLGGDKGLAIIATGYPQSQPIACDSREPVGSVEGTATAGSSSLAYDAATGQYSYVWKTQKSWAGSCRVFTLTLVDGTVHEAYFNFVK